MQVIKKMTSLRKISHFVGIVISLSEYVILALV